jgi:7,8-dihydro-6-hydroxymethylpterin-pyrophosphokinase
MLNKQLLRRYHKMERSNERRYLKDGKERMDIDIVGLKHLQGCVTIR